MTTPHKKLKAARTKAIHIFNARNPDFPWTSEHPFKHWVGGYAQALVDTEAEVKVLREKLAEAKKALKFCELVESRALPKFNWGASVLDAKAIDLLNRFPRIVKNALSVLRG